MSRLLFTSLSDFVPDKDVRRDLIPKSVGFGASNRSFMAFCLPFYYQNKCYPCPLDLGRTE